MAAILSVRLQSVFPSPVRARGRTSFVIGAVQINRGTPTLLDATITGSPSYEVEIECVEDDVEFHCGCPDFAADRVCHHVWAAVLAAEYHDHLTEATKPRHYEPFPTAHRVTGYEPTGPVKLQLIPAPQTHNKAKPRPQQEPAIPANHQLLYLLDLEDCKDNTGVAINIVWEEILPDNAVGAFKEPKILPQQIGRLPDLQDRDILATLAPETTYTSYGYFRREPDPIPFNYYLSSAQAKRILPSICKTGRFFLFPGDGSGLQQYIWDEGEPWKFEIDLLPNTDPATQGKAPWVATALLRRMAAVDGDSVQEMETMPASEPFYVSGSGHLFLDYKVSHVVKGTALTWLFSFRKRGDLLLSQDQVDDWLIKLRRGENPPKVNLPPELRFEDAHPPCTPCIYIESPSILYGSSHLSVNLSFAYDDWVIDYKQQTRGYFDKETRRYLHRNVGAESAALRMMQDLGVVRRPYTMTVDREWCVPPKKFAALVRTLATAGWHIESDKKVFRAPGKFLLGVETKGLDWFELRANVEYGDTSVTMPKLLEALRMGEGTVPLEDGNVGVLPEEWLNRFGSLLEMGTAEEGCIRFRRSQAGLLDALLATQPNVSCDAQFAEVRKQLRDFHGVHAIDQPATFQGQLRDYQRQGLGWLVFLQRFGFGGCLADDMGVGKTAQVLALLETRRLLRRERKVSKPSLIVVPRSLVFNWLEEAKRFTPKLRVLDYSGGQRGEAEISDFDVVLVTYGVMRRDAVHLRDVEFDYVVLDEAQAIKNASTSSAKAARLLNADHRLALSGTPIENHLGELWSLFEFLNPGILGAASVFKEATNKRIDEFMRQSLAQALRPFILRRTKEQVLRELPAKTEQTLFCELAAPQRKLYNELREHYRKSLLGKVASEGMAKSKFMVLEALLRLRQAACHPGLIDSARSGQPSAKLEALLEQLTELLKAGHKALVFSQFTSMLAIVRERLDHLGLVYEYLDGQTSNRQAPVKRFQTDPGCQLFLISLKAGGLGLNLTAAEYVFILDPWWNPAVEAQAVDRAHRIGQQKPVFAYRIIAKDTVEEKILEMQASKRTLAAAIIGEDNSLLKNLQREDLELLLS